MSCVVCGRDARGYGYQRGTAAMRRRACSIMCLDILVVRGGDVLELTHFEKQAIDAASDAAGSYLEEIGKSDLATLTPEEWRHLLSLVFVRSTAEVQRLADEGAVPF